MIALVSIAFIIYSVYMVLALARLQDFPISLSASHYAWESKWQFPFMMISVALLLLPVWIELTPEQWRFLPFISCAGMCFVGCSAEYRDPGIARTVHLTAAYIGSVTVVLCLIFVLGGFITLLSSFIVHVTIGLLTRKFKETYTYWLENCAIIALFIVLYKNLL